jgi:hypothetical protein
MRATLPVHLIFPDFIILVILGEEYKFAKYYWDDQIENDEMCEACSMHVSENKCI